MLKFIKKLFKEEEITEEKINFSELSNWLDNKEKPLLDNLKNEVNKVIKEIESEKEKLFDNIKKLKNAKLQNPNIPNRVKTIMEGNRSAFIKKVSHVFENIGLKYSDFEEIKDKSKELEKTIHSLGKGTARSYQILNEFFAREVSSIAINIKNIENKAKGIRESNYYNKISSINEIKHYFSELNGKMQSKERLLGELKSEKSNLENSKEESSEIKRKIKGIKSGEEYKNFEELLRGKENLEKGIKNIENMLFHDFSVLERALKKYSKVSFENEKLIEGYLKNFIKALDEDNELIIVKAVIGLRKAIEENKLGLDNKKSKKVLSKTKELDKEYFSSSQSKYKEIKEKLGKVTADIRNSKTKKHLDDSADKLKILEGKIESLNNKISILNNEIEKIDSDKLRQGLQEKINNKLNEKITLL